MLSTQLCNKSKLQREETKAWRMRKQEVVQRYACCVRAISSSGLEYLRINNKITTQDDTNCEIPHLRNQKLIKAKTHAQNKSLYLSSIISDKRIAKVSSFHRFSLLIFQDRLVTSLSLYYYESIIMDQFF